MTGFGHPSQFSFGSKDIGFPQGGGPAAFLPSDLAGLQVWCRNGTGLWQDAGKTTPAGTGDPVRVWEDSSGNANDMTAAADANRPTNDAGGAIHFDATNDALTGTNALTLKPATFFCLINMDSTAGSNYMLGGTTNGGLGVNANTTFLQLNTTSTANIATASTQVSASAWLRLIITYSGTGEYAFYIDGVAAGSGTNDVAVASSVIQMGFVNAGVLLDAAIKDYGVYDSVYSGADITSIDDYLASL